MKTLQKFGGIAALYEAAAYIVGMIGFLTVVNVSSTVSHKFSDGRQTANGNPLYVQR